MALAYTPELLARASAWAALPLTEKRQPVGLEALAALYGAITGQAIGSCRQCQYSDYAALIGAYIREATHYLYPETVSDLNYTIAPGFENEQFVHESYGRVVTAANLTNEDAEFFIANGGAHLFVRKPVQKKAAEAEVAPVPAPAPKAADKKA